MRSTGLERALVALAVLLVIGAFVAVTVPFTRPGHLMGHDAHAHITNTFLFDRALGQGQVPVRWVEWVRPGRGYPAFNFYPPGFYYLSQVLHAVGLPLAVALKALVPLLWCTGGLFTFLWLRPLGGLPAALGAAFFVLSPYLILDAFVRGAYPELAAVSFAPGLLWSIDRVVRSGAWRDVLRAAAFTGAMLLCHLLSSLIVGPIAGAYAIHRLIVVRGGVRTLGLLAAGALLGAGLAAFFVLPAQVELSHVTIGRMSSGYYTLRDHFLDPTQLVSGTWGYGGSVSSGAEDGMSFAFGALPWVVLALAAASVPLGWLTRRVPHVGTIVFWLAVVAIVSWLMTPWSTAVWDHVPMLAYLQFPWRYLMVLSVAIAALAALVLSAIPNRTARAAMVIVLLVAHYALERPHLKPSGYVPTRELNIDNPRWPEIIRLQKYEAFYEPGFVPVAARREPPRDIDRWSIVRGAGDARVVEALDHRLVLDVQTTEGLELRINSPAFPGWLVVVDDAPAQMTIDRDYGFPRVTVPPGTHRVEARFTNTPVRTVANAISLASAAVWLAGAIWCVRRRRRRSFTDGTEQNSATDSKDG